METSTGKRQVLLVLGMHRSGTSATAGLFAQLGARMAATPMPADRNNPHGYWESEAIFRLHDRLLAEAGSAWDDWGRLDDAGLAAAGGAEGARAVLAAAFLSEFGAPSADGGRLAVLKDPRICRFLPLWREVFATVGVEPLAVLPLRHPLAVADSLARRDGIAEEDALLLWLRHALDAEAGSRGMPRVFLGYDDLVADWRTAADRVTAALGIAWPVPPETAAPEVDTFLSSDLRHHVPDPDAALPAWVAEGWAALGALAAGDVLALPRLDGLRAALDDGDALMGVAARRQGRRAAEAEAARTAAEASAAATAMAAEAAAAELRQEAAAALIHHEAVRGALAAHVAELEAAVGTALAAHAAEAATLEARARAAEAACEAEAAARSAEREAFLASRSWRLTAPIRALGRALHRAPDAGPAAALRK